MVIQAQGQVGGIVFITQCIQCGGTDMTVIGLAVMGESQAQARYQFRQYHGQAFQYTPLAVTKVAVRQKTDFLEFHQQTGIGCHLAKHFFHVGFVLLAQGLVFLAARSGLRRKALGCREF